MAREHDQSHGNGGACDTVQGAAMSTEPTQLRLEPLPGLSQALQTRTRTSGDGRSIGVAVAARDKSLTMTAPMSEGSVV
jgi:hypothetical protein